MKHISMSVLEGSLAKEQMEREVRIMTTMGLKPEHLFPAETYKSGNV